MRSSEGQLRRSRPADRRPRSKIWNTGSWTSRSGRAADLVAWLFGAFACLALALAAVGLYSVVSYIVVQRTNEFGIRIALGAQRGHVLAIVFRSMAFSVGAGIVAGILLTLALDKVMATWDAESSRDPLLLAAATLALCAGCSGGLRSSSPPSGRYGSHESDPLRVTDGCRMTQAHRSPVCR